MEEAVILESLILKTFSEGKAKFVPNKHWSKEAIEIVSKKLYPDIGYDRKFNAFYPRTGTGVDPI